MKKLLDWVKKKCIKQKGMAEKIGVSEATLHEILLHNKSPNLKVAYAIEIFTEGDITIYDFIDDIKLRETKKTTNKKVIAK
jgi:DNA-binding XRE family transcriptional regulator